MNTRSIYLLPLLLSILSCLQGPWEYLPENRPVFRGLTVNAYIIAGRPLTNICIDRLYALDEANTLAFPFYDSAHVKVTGNGGNGKRTVVLAPGKECPMCFNGPDDFIGQPGEIYRLEAAIWWDSAGTDVRSTITGDAAIPSSWKLDRFAKVNKAAVKTSGSDSLFIDNPLLRQLFGDLPPEVLSVCAALYLPEITPLLDDSTALRDYLAENGQRINHTVDSLVEDESQYVPYSSGDTLLYLTGALNLIPHYFKVDYSDDVAGVLITHTFDTNSIIAYNRFDDIASTFGELTPSHFYVPGTEYRLQYLPVITDTTSDNPIKLFDAIPILNAAMHGGKNTFYFYGTDSSYANFVRTYIEQHTMPDVTPINSVHGAQGFFTGMIADSFTVYITVPSDVQAYTSFETRADFCSERDWDSKDCRCFEQSYCRKVLFNEMQYAFDHPDSIREPKAHNDCLAEAVAYYLEQGKPVRYMEDSLLHDGTTMEYDFRDSSGTTMKGTRTFSDNELTMARQRGMLLYCFRTDFEDTICSEIEHECRVEAGYKRDQFFTWCEDNNWQSASCKWAAVLYCREAENPPKALCKAASQWCEDNPDDPLCR